MNQYDVIIIGAGHNGLVTAAYLAKAGRRVLVLERRSLPGGQLVTESMGDGWQADSLHPGAQLRADIVRDLGLTMPAITRAPFTTLLGDGERLVFGADLQDDSTLESIRRHSAKDAARWPEFLAFMAKATRFLEATSATAMPHRLPKVDLRTEGLPLAKLGLKLRGLGKRDMFNFIRALPMNTLEFAEEWFESAAMHATLAAASIHGHTLGPLSAGTGYTLMHNWLNRGGLAHPAVAGGVGGITRALADRVLAAGGEIRTGSTAAQVRITRSKATGVILASGEEFAADTVFSAADPRHTLLELVGARELPPEFVWNAQAIKMRGAVAKLHLQTDGTHGIPAGTLAHAPSLKHLERAYDASKYGQISEHPYLELNASGNNVSVHFQFAPFKLRDGDWERGGATVQQRALDTLSSAFPALAASVRQARVITPLALERDYGLTEGDMNHGQLILDQFFFMRPIPGFADHRTPIEALHLCGSGCHGGGGINGASGRNAAKQFLAGRLGAPQVGL